MIIKELQINEKYEEHVQGMSVEFPYTTFYGELDNYVGGYAPWHWHEELEFFFVERGIIEFHTQEGVYVFESGEGGFINSNTLHMIKPQSGSQNSLLKTHVFNKKILIGTYNSVFDIKYVAPILSCQNLNVFKFDSKIVTQKEILYLLKKSYHIADMEEYLYEFEIRNLLSKVWMLFVKETKDILNHSKHKSDIYNERIKVMLLFIQQYYSNKIELKDIARVADISERECLRCFKRGLEMTPFEYLTSHRIRSAVNMLVNTNESIINISSACGFSSNSYFGKVFKETMRCTPSEYRKNY